MLTKPKPGATINMAHPLSKGLVGFWLFNEGSGNLANDISGNKNYGILKNMLPNAQGTKWAGSKFGGGLAFNDTDDYVDCGNNPSLFPDVFTVEAWVKTTANETGTLITWGGYKPSIKVPITVSGVNYYDICLNSNNLRRFKNTPVNVTDGNWHHVAFVVTGNGQNDIDNSKMYADGQEQDILVTVKTDSPATKTKCEIGRADIWNTYNFNGILDEVCIYNRALSAEEVKQLYLDPFCNLLKIPIYQHYVLGPPHTNLGIGGTITDPSGNPIEGATIKLENRTLGEYLTNETSDVNGEYAMDLANLANQWSDADVLIINVEARGYRQTVVTAANDSVPSLEVNFNNTIQRILMVM